MSPQRLPVGRGAGRLVVAALFGLACAVSPAAQELSEAEVLNNQGALHARDGRYAEAAEAFRQAIRLAPDFAVAYFNLGLAENRLGQYDGARRSLETAVRIRPDYADAWFHLGRVLQAGKAFPEAVRALQMALSLKPQDPDVLYWLGIVAWRMSDWAAAAAHWQVLVSTHPDHGSVPKVWDDLPRAFCNHAISIRHTQPEEARKAYGEALRLRPSYVEALRGLGQLELDQGRPAEAAVALREALAWSADDPAGLVLFGKALAALDSLDAAVEQYEAAMALEPGYVPARYGLAEVFLRQGEVGKARGAANQILLSTPNDPASHRFWAFVREHNESGERYGQGYPADEAIVGYERALTLGPADAATHFNMGVIYGRQGAWLKARAAFRKALSIDSTHAGVREWLPQVELRINNASQE